MNTLYECKGCASAEPDGTNCLFSCVWDDDPYYKAVPTCPCKDCLVKMVCDSLKKNNCKLFSTNFSLGNRYK